jgi:hypothetical protein
MCSLSLQSMCTMPGCCLLFCRPYDVVNPWCSMAGTLPSFCVHHISAHIQAIFQNTKLDKILFLSVFLLFSLFWGRSNIQVLHIKIIYAKEENCRPSDLKNPVLAYIATPILSFSPKTLVNYKTSPWIQSKFTHSEVFNKKIQQNSSKECITYSWLIHKMKLQNQPLDSNLHAQKSLKKKKTRQNSSRE